VEELRLSMPCQQPRAELAEDAVIEARVAKLQAQGIFPIDSTPDGIGGLTVGQSLGVLHDRNECQAPGRACWLPAGREGRGERVIREERAESIAHAQIDVASREGSAGDAGRLLRDRPHRFGTQRHGLLLGGAHFAYQRRASSVMAYEFATSTNR